MTEEFVQEVQKMIREDRRMTVDELHEKCPEVGLTVPYETVTEKFQFRKLCARWVPKMLTDEHKANQVRAALDFLNRYELEGKISLTQ